MAARKSSSLGAAFNILCTVVGTGLLQLPHGIAQSGWLGVMLLTLMASMACYTAYIIVRCFDHMKPQPLRDGLMASGPTDDWSARAFTYADIGQAAFGRAGAWFVSIQMHLTLTLVGTIYQLLAAHNLHDLIAPEADQGSGSDLGWLTPQVCVLIVGAVVSLHVFLKTLSEVAVLSYFNIAVNAALTAIVLYESAIRPPQVPPKHRLLVTDDLLSLGGAFASFGFAFGVHPVLPSVYATMAKPSQYGWMIVLSFVGVMCFYLPMCMVGYGVYGESVATVIYDTPEMHGSAAVQAVIALITVHLLCSYPIVLNPPERALEALWECNEAAAAPSVRASGSGARETASAQQLPSVVAARQRSASVAASWISLPIGDWAGENTQKTSVVTKIRQSELMLRVILRLGFVAFTTAVSLAVPIDRFGPFLNLVSAFTSTFTVFILPCVFYVKLAGVHNLSVLELAWNVCILILSIVGATFGTIDAAKSLFRGLR